MSAFRALLLFPFRPAAAARAVRGSWAPLAAFPVWPASVAAMLVAAGCRAGDALATGAAFALLALGLAAGGAVAAIPALLLLGRPPRPPLAACLLFGSWWVFLFCVLLGAAKLMGAGGVAALAVGFALLVWGVLAGIGVLGAGEDPGKGLVASCLGASGAVFGLLAAGLLAQAQLVLFAPAPTATDGLKPGDPMLVRADGRPRPGDLALMREAASSEVVLASISEAGEARPVGADPGVWRRGEWVPIGRVFFGFTGVNEPTVIRRKAR